MIIPKLKKIKTTKNYHGIPLEDNYSWVDQPNILEVLKDPKKLNKEVEEYIEANNKITEDYFKDIKGLQKNLFNEIKVPIVIHTGDISNANTLEQFSKLNSKLIGVYGNNDRNELGLEEVAQKNKFQFQDPPRKLSLLDKEIVIFHEPDKIDQFLSENKLIDVVLYGHTHRYENNTKNGVLFFNPGESAGMQKGSNAIGILDLKNMEAKRIFF